MDNTQQLKQIFQRYDHAKQEAMAWRAHFEDCYYYAIPNRNTYLSKTHGIKQGIDIYDPTAIIATITYVAHLMTSLTPLGVDWAELRAGIAIPRQYRDNFNRQLQPLNELLFDYIHNSNYYQALSESHKDLAVGTGVLMCREGDSDDRPFIFEAVPLEFVYPEQGAYGQLDTIFRDIDDYPLRQLLVEYPEAKLSAGLRMMLDRAPDSKINLAEGSMYDAKKKEYHYVLIHRDAWELLFEDFGESSPWIPYRGSKMPNELFGRGPIMEALGAIKTLNEMAGDELKAAALIANPMWFGVSDGVFNPHNLNLQPNSIIPIANMGSKPLEVVQAGGNIQFEQLTEEKLVKKINQIFFTNPLGDIAPNSNFTATEIQIRKLQDMEDREPSIGRIIPELLDRLIGRVIYILQKRKLFPKLNIDGRQVTLHYKSPLLKSQNLANVINLTHGVQTLQSIVGTELAPRLLNIEKIPEYIFEQLGIDLELVKEPDEIVQEMQQYAQALQQQQQQGQAQLPTPPQGGIQQPQGQAQVA